MYIWMKVNPKQGFWNWYCNTTAAYKHRKTSLNGMCFVSLFIYMKPYYRPLDFETSNDITGYLFLSKMKDIFSTAYVRLCWMATWLRKMKWQGCEQETLQSALRYRFRICIYELKRPRKIRPRTQFGYHESVNRNARQIETYIIFGELVRFGLEAVTTCLFTQYKLRKTSASSTNKSKKCLRYECMYWQAPRDTFLLEKLAAANTVTNFPPLTEFDEMLNNVFIRTCIGPYPETNLKKFRPYFLNIHSNIIFPFSKWSSLNIF
jgi:hypothetical protein